MSSFIDDVMGVPRRRSRTPGKSPLSTPPLQRQQTTDVFHSALAVPTQATLTQEAAAKVPDNMEAPAGVPEKPAGSETADQELPAISVHHPAELPPTPEVSTTENRSIMEADRSSPVPDVEAVQERSIADAPSDQASTLHIIQEPIPVVHHLPAFLIGISGCTSSGKRLLSHLLTSILPSTTPWFILHQNDFFVPQHLLVPSRNDALDADCREAINFTSLIRVITYAKARGKLPLGFHSEQDEDDVHKEASELVSSDVIDELKTVMTNSVMIKEGQVVGLVDGFLLYLDPEIRDLLDVKLFLRAPKEKAVARRMAKPDYVEEGAEEDFWTTEEYFHTTAWPNYVEEHSPLFRNKDVEGEPLFDLCNDLNIAMHLHLRWRLTKSCAGQPRVFFKGSER